MKSTGIIRKIDKLGRIVIPKEIRKNLKIRDEETLEIFIDNEDIIFKKYSAFNRLKYINNELCNTSKSILNKNIVITDMEKVVACNDKINDTYLNKELNIDFINIIEKRSKLEKDGSKLSIIDKNFINNYIMSPIIINGELYGSIVIFSNEYNINDYDKFTINFILKYLEKNIED